VIIRSVATPAAVRDEIERAVVRGSEALKQGKLDEAQQAFRAALGLDAGNPRVLALLGLAHFRGNQFDQARTIYHQLVERAPTDASHRLNLGLVYLKLGDAVQAINSLEASRALDPSQGRAVSYLGLAYARAGRYAEAYRSFLLAGQHELASEIESNLTITERDSIHAQLARTGLDLGSRNSSRDLTPEAAAPVTPAPAGPAPDAEPRPVPATAPVRPSRSSLRNSESAQFVLPKSPVPQVAAGRSMLSAALETATPASSVLVAHTPASSQRAIPLSQLATEQLVRPDHGDERFEVSSSGALVIRVDERVHTRLVGVHATGGDLAFEPALRRSRGHQTDERFDYGGPPLHVVTGHGYLIAVPGKRPFTAVTLDDDILYLREDLVFAFDSTLRWENGHVPGLRGRLPVVQFRGDGSLVLRSEQPLTRVKLPPSGVVYVDASRLAGWIGRVIPRAVVPPNGAPMGEICVECTGEGVVLLDAQAAPEVVITKAEAVRRPRQAPPAHAPGSADADADAGSGSGSNADADSDADADADAGASSSGPSAPAELDITKTAEWLGDDAPGEPGRDEI
jgi:hypothetical protein